MKSIFVALVFVGITASSQACAAEITVIGPGGVRAAVQALIPGFERSSGHTVKATFGSGGGTKDRVIKGEHFDLPIVQPPLEPVIASGHVVTTSQKLLAEVPIGLAVRAGAAKPDISSAESVRRLLLGAKSIAYPNAAGSPTGGAAGVSFNATLARLGIAETLKPKIKSAQNGAAAMAMVAHGEVEIGLTFLSEMITEPGILVVGTLPRDISVPTQLVGFLSAHAADGAQALLAYLTGPQAAAVYRDKGMVPGAP